jgi:DNA-binding GntR family transcriptional regulator
METETGPFEQPEARPARHLERIVAALEEDIVFGHLHPRERLIEADIAARFGVNRHVVRQALAVLDSMGLVERLRNRGAMVRDFRPEDAEKIYLVRERLEIACAEILPLPARPEIVERLAALQRRHDEGSTGRDLRRVFRINVEFHRLLYGTCENAYLVEAIEHHAQRAHAIRSYSMTRPDYLEEVRREHWAMIDALREGDRPALIELCRRHLERARIDYVEAYRARYPSLGRPALAIASETRINGEQPDDAR